MTSGNNKKGWGRPWNSAFRHYFQNGTSLCGRITCFNGDMSAKSGDNEERNCPKCRQLLSERKAKQYDRKSHK